MSREKQVKDTNTESGWIKSKEYNGYETILTDCKCPVCGEEALLKRSYSMDGESIVLYPSNYCPNCGKDLREKKVRDKNGWIPVSERLPNLDDYTGSERWQKEVMKKLKIFVAAIACIFLLGGCDDLVEQKEQAKQESMFVIIENSYWTDYYIVYHRDTKVMYAISNGSYNRGEFTLLVNSDGTPMTYKE